MSRISFSCCAIFLLNYVNTRFIFIWILSHVCRVLSRHAGFKIERLTVEIRPWTLPYVFSVSIREPEPISATAFFLFHLSYLPPRLIHVPTPNILLHPQFPKPYPLLPTLTPPLLSPIAHQSEPQMPRRTVPALLPRVLGRHVRHWRHCHQRRHPRAPSIRDGQVRSALRLPARPQLYRLPQGRIGKRDVV